jgi:hypothetical protein
MIRLSVSRINQFGDFDAKQMRNALLKIKIFAGSDISARDLMK